MTGRVADRIGQAGALAGFRSRGAVGLPRGWTPPDLERVARELLAGRSAPLVVEVGAWCGRSTVILGRVVQELGGELVSVDTWLGSPEFWVDFRGRDTHDLRLVDGYPTVYREWAQNVADAGLVGTVTPLPISSREGAEVLRRIGTRAALVYLDAAHERDAVLEDLRTWWPLVEPGGCLFGDDLSEAWPGVGKALVDFTGPYAGRRRSLRTHGGGLWSLPRPREDATPPG